MSGLELVSGLVNRVLGRHVSLYYFDVRVSTFPDNVIDCHLPLLSAPGDYHNRRSRLFQSDGCCFAYTGIPACNEAYPTSHIVTSHRPSLTALATHLR